MVRLEALEAAAKIVYADMPATPQYCWPLLSQRLGCQVWVKHENHSPVGAFKLRGGLVYIARLKQSQPDIAGVVLATKGNHGQSIASAARKYALAATIVVPEDNSILKNKAMVALGAQLVVAGRDFHEALEVASKLAIERNLHFVPSFHPDLVLGVGTYSLEFLRAVPALETIYVPIGLGSGICGMIAARNALNLKTQIVGVVAENAPAYALSYDQKRLITTPTAQTVADGIACRTPNAEALQIILNNVERIVRVSDEEVLQAMGVYFSDTHNIAEGAGAAALAALMQEQAEMKGHHVGIILSGGNVDTPVYEKALATCE